MNEQANKIQAVISTLETLNIQPTYENMNKLFGCMQVLKDVMGEVSKDGNDNPD